MSLAALRAVTSPLAHSAGILGVIGAALDARTGGTPIDANLQPEVDAVLDALGVRDVLGTLSPGELHAVLAEIRMTLGHGARLTFGATRTQGWSFTDPAILQAAGDTSAGFAMACKQMVVPTLAGLAAKMEAGGAFLDVGTGVGAFAIAMARQWPSLRVTGVDVWAPSIAIAKENVRAAGMSDRIEVREQGGQDVPERDAFDLAWVPSLFIPSAAVDAIVQRVLVALRPGGWILFAIANPGKDALSAAYVRLRTKLWGGPALQPADAERMLTMAGYSGTAVLPSPLGSPVLMIAGQRSS